jgi:uncharacterized protein (TIGR02588 family)
MQTKKRSTNKKSPDNSYIPEKNWLEWLIFGLSLMVTIGIVGYLGWMAFFAPQKPAQVKLEIGQPQLKAGMYEVPVKVLNEGDESIEHLRLYARPIADVGSEPLTADLDYLPKGGDRETVFMFKNDSAKSGIEVFAGTYIRP